MTPPEVTAADRATARQIANEWAGESLRIAEAMHDLDNRIATALATVRAEGYAAGAQAHVEHHRCERCYGAGIVVGQALLP